MLTNFLKLAVGIFAASIYVVALYFWIYRNRIWPALAAILVLYPLLLGLTRGTPWMFLRVIPVIGVGMFVHRYGLRTLNQIRLLWFTTLSVVVVQAYYWMIGVY